MKFEELGLAQPILRAVAASGYETPTPIQAESIPHLLEGRNLLGSAQTGTGKTAAFALPILHRLTQSKPPKGAGRRIRALILAPTRELASQIGESLFTYGCHTPLRFTVVFGGVSQRSQVRALQKGVDILVATPGRLGDLMNQGYINLDSVSIFVLDEADRMLDMGFLPEMKRVIAQLPAREQTLFFSATMPPAVEQLANSILDNPVRVQLMPERDTTELIDQRVRFVPFPQKTRVLMDLLADRSVMRAIVFARTKHGSDRLAEQLQKAGIPAEAMHGNKTQAARQRILASFKSNRPPVLVATDVAARGLDVDGVSHVFNYELPNEPETYVHRIGRTGRAGAAGVAISLCSPQERFQLRAIERLMQRRLEVDYEPGTENQRPPMDEAPRRPDRRPHRPSNQGGPPRRRNEGAAPEGANANGPRPGVHAGNRPQRHPKPQGRRPGGARPRKPMGKKPGSPVERSQS